MAQKIITICDACQADEEPARQADTLRINDVLVDLCGEHQNSMTLTELVGALELGDIASRPAEPVKNKRRLRPKASLPPQATVAYSDADDLSCPYGCNNGKPFTSIQGKRQHMTRQHKDAA